MPIDLSVIAEQLTKLSQDLQQAADEAKPPVEVESLLLPPHVLDQDSAAVAEARQIPQKFAEATSGRGVSWGPLHEYSLFNALVREGFVPKTEDGYATMVFYRSLGTPDRLRRGLYDFNAFLSKFYGGVYRSERAKAVANGPIWGVDTDKWTKALDRWFGVQG